MVFLFTFIGSGDILPKTRENGNISHTIVKRSQENPPHKCGHCLDRKIMTCHLIEGQGKVQKLMLELFQFDYADPDCGTYCIMSHKRGVLAGVEE